MGLETDLAEFWFEPGLFLDLDDPSVLQRFRTPAGTAADLGSDGMKTTGVLPAVYLTKDFADSGVTFFQNHGYGGGPIEVWETYTPVYGAVQSDPRSAMWCSRSARRPHGGRRSSRSGRPRRTAPDPSVRCPGRNGRADAPGRQGAVRADAGRLHKAVGGSADPALLKPVGERVAEVGWPRRSPGASSAAAGGWGCRPERDNDRGICHGAATGRHAVARRYS